MIEALKRKLGPLPVWVWALIGGAALYWYRNRTSAAQSGTGTGSVAPAPNPNPQPQSILQPGESVYDPNTGTLSTAPGGGGTSTDNGGSGTGGGGGSAPGDSVTPPDSGTPGDSSSPTGNPTGTAAFPAPGTSAGPHGATYLRSGPTKPKAPKGFRTVGIGNGGWIAVPLAVKGRKPGSNSKPKTGGTSASKGSQQNHPRSTATVRNAAGGRTVSSAARGIGSALVGGSRGLSRTVKPAASIRKANTVRPRATAPVRAKPVTQQHSAQVAPKVAPPSPPRPSAPKPGPRRVNQAPRKRG